MISWTRKILSLLALLAVGIAVSGFIGEPVSAATVGELEPTTGTWRVYRGTGSTTFVCSRNSEQAAKDCAAVDAEARRTTTRYQIRYPNRYATATYAPTVPTPVNCAVSDWSAWAGGAWGACANGTQTRQETRARIVVTQPANGGTACPVLSEARTASQACTATPPDPTQPVVFRADFSRAPNYGFGYKYPEGNWRATHLPTGGMTGGPAVRVTQAAGRQQYNLGWATPALNAASFRGEAYLRLRIRYHESFRFSNARNKLVMFGTEGSRAILYQNGPDDNQGCTLGMRDWSNGGRYYPTSLPSHFGLTGIRDDWSNAGGMYGGLAWKKNIDWTCAGPALVRPGQWHRVQVYVKAGSPPTLRIWINNGDVAKPTALPQQTLTESLTSTGWTGAVIGGYQDVSPGADLIYDLDAFEIGTTFDPNW